MLGIPITSFSHLTLRKNLSKRFFIYLLNFHIEGMIFTPWGLFGYFQVYMSVVKSCGKIGIAYYDTENCQIKMMEDVVETENFRFLRLS